MKKTFSIFICIVLVFSYLPINVFAVTNGGSVTIVYGDSASDAGVVLYDSEDTPYESIEFESAEPHQQSFTGSYKGAWFIWFDRGFEDEFTFIGWKVTKPDGNSFFASNEKCYIGVDDNDEDIKAYCHVLDGHPGDDTFTDDTASVIRIYKSKITDGNWTIEPIFEKKGSSSSSPYEFSLENKGTQNIVDKGDTVTLEMYVDGAAYDALSAVISYDSSLFEYKACSQGITVDSTVDGSLKISATGLGKSAGDVAAEIAFTAKATKEEKTGDFVITTAKASTSAEALVGDAAEAATGDALSITVKASAYVTVTYPAGDPDEIESGEDVTFTLSEKYSDYEATGFTYTVTADPFEVEDNQDGTYTIKAVDENVTVVVKKNPEGELETYDLRVGQTTYRVAKFTGNPGEGKTFLYDGEAMVKCSDGYRFIIGTSGDAIASMITVEVTDGEIVMKSNGDVNQTGVIDINDAQVISDIYNGTYTDGYATVTMVKFLAADVNGDNEIDMADIARVVGLDGFVY